MGKFDSYRHEASNLVVESSTLSRGASVCGGRGAYSAMQSPEYIQIVQLLLARLERVSVDSYWAHRASGIRGSLLRALERLETGDAMSGPQLDAILDQGFAILERAARDRAH